MKAIAIAALLLSTVVASSPTYPADSAAEYPAPASYTNGNDYSPMPYNFAWAVKDDYSYNDYGHQATADDKGYVQGSYRVALPDGRTQIVNYRADDYNGYVADVQYEGVAKYDYKPAYNNPTYPTAESSAY